jgi:uncharacterized protein (TIGR00255 family)
MTGFGRAELQNGRHRCKVEVRSVNNRFIEVNTRLPKSFVDLELPLKKRVKSQCARGSFDLALSFEQTDEVPADSLIEPNLALASQYHQAFDQIRKKLNLAGEVDINAIIGLRDVVQTQPMALDDALKKLTLDAVDQALSALIHMRTEEGKNLHVDIAERLNCIAERAGFVKSRHPLVVEEYKSRLLEKIKVLTDGGELDAMRLAQETALLADRSDVTEEITRLESHVQQFQNLMNAGEPIGRKLEFITQEINREVNTIGSKSADFEISQSVIEMKSDMEKIREQLQNIE